MDRRTYRRRSVLGLVAEGAGTTITSPPGTAPDLPDELVEAARTSETGSVAYLSRARSMLVLPPFPVVDEGRWDRWTPEPLERIFDAPRSIGVILLRLGGYAVGVYHRDVLVASKVGSRFVKGRHGKGGSSQARFQRRREEQAKALFKKACAVAEERLDGPLDHLILGGDRRTVASFAKACPLVDRLTGVRMERFLHVVDDPRHATLVALPRQIYESVVLEVQVSRGD